MHCPLESFLTGLQINEAFASMYVYCVRKLGIDPEKVNVNGGAIAIGHPLDKSICLFPSLPSSNSRSSLRCTGARQIATGLNELDRRNGKVCASSDCFCTLSTHHRIFSKILVTSMCIGTGMGAAAVFVRD